MTADDLRGAALLLAYYLVVCVGLPTLLRHAAGLPFEWARKLQHIAYSLSIFLLLRLFSTWIAAAAAAALLLLMAYPALVLMERGAWYRRTFVDRTARGGELRRQLLYVQLSFALLLFVFWGLLDMRPVIGVAVMAWGFGDAAAALVGKALGRRRIVHRLIESAKTFEGTIAMMVVGGLALWLTLIFYAGVPWPGALLLSLLVAPLCGVVELFSRRGTDTLTVPLSAALALVPLMRFAETVGW
jgi:phytol kinase